MPVFLQLSSGAQSTWLSPLYTLDLYDNLTQLNIIKTLLQRAMCHAEEDSGKMGDKY